MSGNSVAEEKTMGGIPPQAVEEVGLVERIRRGDLAAVTTIMQRKNHALWRIARAILKDESEAEDAVQDAYVSAFTHLGDFRGESSLSTWLSRITVNEALRRLRQRRPTVPLSGAVDVLVAHQPDAMTSAAASNPEHTAARREIGRLAEQAIDALEPPFRSVFVMRIVEQMSTAETARCLGIRPETVKTRLHRANLQLRARLGGELAAVFEGVFPFAGARCERLQRAVLVRLGLSADIAGLPMH
jgi:RNA polymerase sigma-70 factor, ECF subfamily